MRIPRSSSCCLSVAVDDVTDLISGWNETFSMEPDFPCSLYSDPALLPVVMLNGHLVSLFSIEFDCSHLLRTESHHRLYWCWFHQFMMTTAETPVFSQTNPIPVVLPDFSPPKCGTAGHLFLVFSMWNRFPWIKHLILKPIPLISGLSPLNKLALFKRIFLIM